ncbi:LuxR family transcriptional regulator [Chryseobacterium luquanense]|uniref:LuxR family transcriptional regulator n=1 Tax=Chryseobacterium luquanense TaxID=2983766 RepID=A0ABT3Y4J7_9FLAO|nr:LuxR family transcriptional regulator [Chryseobacterium luquanense]MCX8533060.1 LuxR family transcriptional regulator [Chryseobacterium luquanense]
MTVRLYPGMLDTSKEYFNHGDHVLIIKNGSVKKFEDVDQHPELNKILDDEVELNLLLDKWFGNNTVVKLRTLARCRFGALNFTPDFSNDSSSHDYCECEYRGNCEGENIICKPVVFNGSEISDQEIKLLQELSTNEKNTAIADNLGLPIGTLNVNKTKTYQKFGLITKQQLTKDLFLEGLL